MSARWVTDAKDSYDTLSRASAVSPAEHALTLEIRRLPDLLDRPNHVGWKATDKMLCERLAQNRP